MPLDYVNLIMLIEAHFSRFFIYNYIFMNIPLKNKPKIFITDVDGTLTDGTFTYTKWSNKPIDKITTSTIDFYGLFLLNLLGIKIIIISTTSKRKSLKKRTKNLKVDYLIEECFNKHLKIEEILKKERLTWEDVAYIGDDVNDRGCLTRAKYKACPQNATKTIKEISNIHICNNYGGHGAVREFIEETGLFFITNLINKNIETHQINLYDSNNLSGILTYFVIKIDSLNDIGLDDYIVSKNILNPNEISWAGFVDIQVAYQYLEYGQLIILDRLDK